MSRSLARFIRWCAFVPTQAVRDIREIRKRRARSAAGINAFERAEFSQNGEDGIIAEIFRRLNVANGTFVEFGVEDGMQCNAAALARTRGWHGLFIEASPTHFTALQRQYRHYPGVRLKNAFVTKDNIAGLLHEAEIPAAFDLLSIDIDGNDYWVWQNLAGFAPTVVVIEYNATYPPPASLVVPYDEAFIWDGTTYFGASLSALHKLGRSLGYSLIGTDSRGINAFFIRDDARAGCGFAALSAEEAYHPVKISPFRAGHPWRPGAYLQV